MSQVNNEIINYFNRLTADLCIQFLSNLTISDNCDTLTSTIYGQKKLTIKYYDLRKYDCNNIDYLYKIYSWVYFDNNPDKISIIRNLSTVYLNEEEDFYVALINKSQSIYDSILRNFSIYLRSNIEQYFAARESFINFIDSRANKVTEEIQTITRDMSKTVLTSLAFIFASIFGQKEYSAAIRYLPLFFIIYIIANIFFTHVFSFKNLRNIDSDYKKRQKNIKNFCLMNIMLRRQKAVHQSFQNQKEDFIFIGGFP